MSEDTTDRIDRRSFLRVAGGASAAVALAGCAGEDIEEPDDDDVEPADDTADDTGDDTADDTDDETDDALLDEPSVETPIADLLQEAGGVEDEDERAELLAQANHRAHELGAWVFLNRQYSVYGIAERLSWDPRQDEHIMVDEIGTDGDEDVTITQGQMATTLDPHNHRETSTDNVVLQAYEGILFRDREGRIVSRLATDWERVEPGHVRYEIQDGVQFHEGQDMTAADCAFSINRVVDPDVGIESPQADQLDGITGAEAEGDDELHVYSDGFNPMVFGNQASHCPVVNQEWIEERDSSEIAQEVNGTGPYQLVDYEEDVEVEFEQFDGYWGDSPEIETVRFQAASESSARVSALRAGDTDLIVNVPPQDAPTLEDDEDTSVAAVPSTRVLFLPMINTEEPFDSREFRVAMNYAIDLESIIENILSGFGDPTGQPTLEGYVGEADLDPYPYDPEFAEELIEASGNAGAELELHTPVGRYLGDVEIAQAAAGYIDDLDNVSCEVNQRDFAALADEILDGDMSTSPSFFLIGWGNTTFDASQTLVPWFADGSAVQAFQDN